MEGDVESDSWSPRIRCNYIDVDDLNRLAADSGGMRLSEEPEHSIWQPQDAEDLPSTIQTPLSNTEQFFLDLMVNGTSAINTTLVDPSAQMPDSAAPTT